MLAVMLQLMTRLIEHAGSVESSQEARVALKVAQGALSCSPNFRVLDIQKFFCLLLHRSAVRISLQFHIFLDIRTLKHELIVKPLILKEV